MARTARSEHGIGWVRRVLRMTERRGGGRIGAGSRKIRMVEEVEELHPELGGIPFPPLPELGDREIHVSVVGTGKDPRCGVAQSSVGRRRENSPILNVASAVVKGSDGELLECGVASVRSLRGGHAGGLYGGWRGGKGGHAA